MKPDLCLVPAEQLPIASAKKDLLDPYPKKSKTKKERLLALAQKISQQNAENVNEMFEILKMED